MTDLNSTISQESGWTLQSANGVNDSGWIAGDGLVGGANRAFLLQPAGSSGGGPGGNLLLKPGFEEYTPPLLGAPGWVSDAYRQVAAKSETNQPHSGSQNAACWATDDLDCGMYQDLEAPGTGTYTLTFYANADRPGALVGANVSNNPANSTEIAVRGFRNYGAAYTLTFTANKGDTIRVWMYSPATPGYLVLDDVSLTGPAVDERRAGSVTRPLPAREDVRPPSDPTKITESRVARESQTTALLPVRAPARALHRQPSLPGRVAQARTLNRRAAAAGVGVLVRDRHRARRVETCAEDAEPRARRSGAASSRTAPVAPHVRVVVAAGGCADHLRQPAARAP